MTRTPFIAPLAAVLLLTSAPLVLAQDATGDAASALQDARDHIERGDFAAALPPAQRALAFSNGGAGQPAPSAEASAIAALAAADVSPDAQNMRALILALTRAEEAGVSPGPVLWAGWTFVAETFEGEERWVDANLAADRAIGLLGMSDSPPMHLRQAAARAGARAALNTGDYDVAAWRYAWGAASMAPVSSIGATDPGWVDWVVRAHAARAAWLSLEGNRDDPSMPPVAAPQDVAAPRCAPRWSRAPDASYPRNLAMRRPGAALIEFEILPDGTPGEPSVLAIFPEAVVEFGEQAERAARRWRADPDSLEGCAGVTYVTPFLFVLD